MDVLFEIVSYRNFVNIIALFMSATEIVYVYITSMYCWLSILQRLLFCFTSGVTHSTISNLAFESKEHAECVLKNTESITHWARRPEK